VPLLSEALRMRIAQSAGAIMRFEGSNQAMLRIDVSRLEIFFTQTDTDSDNLIPI